MIARSLMALGNGRVAWIAEPLPDLGGDDVLIETTVGAVSVGSELPIIRGDARASAPTIYPRMTGYESAGVVIGVGGRVADLSPGDRVVSFYGHRTRAVVPRRKAIPVADAMPDEVALLTILTCDVARGIDQVCPEPGRPILVTGAGAIGLLTVWTLATRGLGPVDVVEPIAARRSLAHALGARRTAAPGAPLPVSGEHHVGFECSSRDDGFQALQDGLAHGGRICVLADGNLEPLSLSPDFHARELTVVGSSDCSDEHAHAAWFFGLDASIRDPLRGIYDLRIGAEELGRTLTQLVDATTTPVKILVDYAT